MSIEPLYFEVRDVGKTIKSSKKQYIWRMRLDGKEYTLELFNSHISGKKKIIQNGRTIYQDSKYSFQSNSPPRHKGAFQFPFHLGKNSLNIVQHGDKYELRVNNQSFTHLWEQERTKRNFNYDNKDQYDPYQEKHYAEHYEKSVAGTSRDAEKQLREGYYHWPKPYDPYVNQAKPRQHNNDERFDAELQKALEESKKEEEARQRKVREEEEAKRQKERERERELKRKQQEQAQYNKYDFSTGFDHGFQKYDTNMYPRQTEAKKSGNDFAFQESNQQNDDEFDFSSFGNVQPPPRQQTVKQPSNKIDDLDDLLGGGFSAGPEPEKQNALDFFEQNQIQFSNSPAKSQPQTDIFGNGAPNGNDMIQPSQPQADIFGGSSQPMQPSNPPPEQEKPKFIPNLGGFYGTNQNQSQYMQMMQQQQMQQQMMMQQMMMQQQYGTQMNPMGMPNQNPMGAPNQNPYQFQTYQNNMPNQYMTSMQGGGYQQPMNPQQYPQNQYGTQMQPSNPVPSNDVGASSTPFDMFN